MGVIAWARGKLGLKAADPALDERYWAPIGETLSAAGVRVSADSAMRVSAVYRCVSILANTAALLPGGVYRRLERGRQELPDHPVRRLLWKRPNPYQIPFETKRVLMAWAMMRGSAYARIFRRPGGELELWPLHPDRVKGPELLDGGVRRYIYTHPKTLEEIPYLEGLDILVINGLSLDGLRGLAMSDLARDSIGLATTTEQYGATLFARAARFSGAVQLPVGKTIANPKARVALAESLRTEGAGPRKWHGVPVLEDGMEWKSISMSNDDAQFLECTVPETEIALADGTRKRADEVRAGDVVWGWDSPKSALVPSRVESVGDNGIRDVLTIRTHRGRTITTTKNHPFLAARRARCPRCGRNHAADPQMENHWIKAEELAVGDYVATLDGVAWPGTDEIDPEAAYFIGAMLGDGSLRRNGALAFSNKDEAVIEAVRGFVARFGVNLRFRGGVDYEFRGGSKRGRPAKGETLAETNPLRSFFSELDLLGTDSYSKFIPAAVFRSGARQLREVLAGLFDTDGSVRQSSAPQPMAYLCTTSRRMAGDAQHALSLLGIQAAIRTQQPSRDREAVRYEVIVCGRENIRRLGALPLRHPEKAARLSVGAPDALAKERDVFRRMDRIIEIREEPPRATVSITVHETHSHVTAGLVSHNTRKFSITDIARWFGIPPHMIGDVERSTSWGTGIEAQTIGFVTYGLLPWLTLFEQAFESALILEEDAYLRFNVTGLLRGDAAARFAVYDIAIRSGIYSPNDCREFEEQNPREGGDEYVDPKSPQQAAGGGQSANEPPPAEPPDENADANALALAKKVAGLEARLDGLEAPEPASDEAHAQALWRFREGASALGVSKEATRKLLANAKPKKGEQHA